MTSLSFKKGLILLCCGNMVWAQPDLPGCEWTQFLHENQSVASEGCLVNGIPEGFGPTFRTEEFWKTAAPVSPTTRMEGGNFFIWVPFRKP